MKKIIATLDDIKKETFSLPVSKEDLFVILHTPEEMMSFELYNQLNKFPATVQFIECTTENQKKMMWFLLGNLCAAKTSKQVQVYLVLKQEEMLDFESIKEIMTTANTYECKERIEDIYTLNKKQRSKRNTTASKEKPEKTMKEFMNPPVENSFKKKDEKFISALKKLDQNYDFELIKEPLKEAFINSTESISFEIQLQIRVGRKESEKLYQILVPHYEELKEMLNESL